MTKRNPNGHHAPKTAHTRPTPTPPRGISLPPIRGHFAFRAPNGRTETVPGATWFIARQTAAKLLSVPCVADLEYLGGEAEAAE